MSYDSAWVPDSQTIYSDTHALLALGAANTSRIRLGPGVADAQETTALRDFDPAYVSSGSFADIPRV
jgi:alkanesulfonate monooxygenase SsuD/methylene tetrahydromethanopterin reductase-like flavin-dependent oxidoreductase (luciferase family)